MEMYKCDDCGAIFSEEEMAHWSEGRGEYWGSSCSEEMCGCPHCHSTGYDEVKRCKLCDSYEKEFVDDVCCEECKKELVKRLTSIIVCEFEEEEREALKEMWEELEIL